MPQADASVRRPGPAPALDRDSERTALLEAAVSVLAIRAIDDWTVEEVLAKARLGTRSFYRHFASKEALLAAVMVQRADETGRRLQLLVDSKDTPLEALTAWLDEVLGFGRDAQRASKTREFLRSCITRDRAGWDEARHRLVSSFTGPLAITLKRGIQDGSFPHADLERDVPMIFTLAFGVVTDMGSWLSANDERFVRASVLRYILPALGVPETQPS